MKKFEITNDNVILTSNGTVLTVLLDAGTDSVDVAEKIKKHFPRFDNITEEYLLETVLMVPSPSTNSKVGYPLQTLAIIPSIVEDKKGINLQMRKCAFDGRVIHVDSDTFVIGESDNQNMDILVENFVNYYEHVNGLLNPAGSPA